MTNTKMISSEIYKGVYDSLIKGKKTESLTTLHREIGRNSHMGTSSPPDMIQCRFFYTRLSQLIFNIFCWT